MANDEAARKLLEAAPKDSDQLGLFSSDDAPLNWEMLWRGMPEFKMGNTEAIQKITVSFSSYDDVKRFSKLLGLNVTNKTDFVWWPQKDNYIAPKNFRYVDES